MAQVQVVNGAPPAFVLVHGGFSGGWCWDRVSERLTGAGHRVFTPTLTGLGESAHLVGPEVNLSMHIADIAAVICENGLRDIVLCGHSYGGMVISGVANLHASRIRAMVYLDAVVAEPGTCLWDYLPDELRRQFAGMTSGLVIATGRPGPEIVNPEDAEWFASKSTPHPRATLHEPLPATAGGKAVARNIHVRATGYPSTMLDESHDRAEALGWPCIKLPYSHNVMIDAPDQVAAILMSAAQ